MAADRLRWRGHQHGGSISHVAFDCGDTLTSNRDAVDAALGMRPITAAAKDVIWALDAADVTVALLSNTRPGQDRRPALRAAGVGDLFGGRVYLSDELGMSKPAPDIFQFVLADLGIRPHELLMCGNNLYHDIVPAAALGMPAVLVGPYRGRLPPGALAIAHIADLPDVLTGENPCTPRT